MVFDPRFEAYPSGMERYLHEHVKRIYHELRAELRDQFDQMAAAVAGRQSLAGALGVTASNAPVSNATKVLSGRKIGSVDEIKDLVDAPARKITARVPDAVEVITGFRAWRAALVDPDGAGELRLMALGQDEIWPAKKKLQAKCVTKHNHCAPRMDCSCGVWAFQSLEKLIEALKSYCPVAIGKVSLWGRVIETEHGFRAQYAYPAELWLLDESLEQLGFIYGVPVRTTENALAKPEVSRVLTTATLAATLKLIEHNNQRLTGTLPPVTTFPPYVP